MKRLAIICKAVVPFVVIFATAFTTVQVLDFKAKASNDTYEVEEEVFEELAFAVDSSILLMSSEISTYVQPAEQKTERVYNYRFASAHNQLYDLLYKEYTMPSLTIKKYTTNPVTVNVTRLMAAYDEELECPSWDYKKRIRDINFLWEFLVNQNNVHPTIAAGILGSVCFEGTVGMQQGTHQIFNGMNDVRAKLTADTTGIGYGIVQWTTAGRRAWLLKFYEQANSDLNYDWETKCVVAECCALLEELKKYKLFDNLHTEHDIEDATGRFAVEFEVYQNYWLDWSSKGDVYRLKPGANSGKKRYEYALHIYNYFMGDE